MKTVYYLSMVEDDAASFYRTNGVLPFLKSKDILVKNIANYQKTYGWESLIGADVFIFQRPYHEHHVNLIMMAKDMGIKVICEYDDDLLNVPFHNNAAVTLSEQRANIKKALSIADEVWVTTNSIKKEYKFFNRNIRVIPNAHNDYLYPIKNKKPFNKDTKIAAYRGGASHEDDVYQNINSIVETINENTDWEFRFQGSRFKFIENRTNDNHTYTDPFTIMQFYKSYHELNPNIAFFPLLNNVFNNGKSNISFLEATYAGSAFMGNRDLSEFNLPFIISIQNGFKEEFNKAKDDFYRLEILNNDAWDWILENRLLSKINELRIERILS
jgi:hypothetical protein